MILNKSYFLHRYQLHLPILKPIDIAVEVDFKDNIDTSTFNLNALAPATPAEADFE